ncbi:MAG: HAD family hydrolase, partial [Campylobacteraceae bacterium]|nr:HAD family hydrolase [Campylobacteraceae bacterium]
MRYEAVIFDLDGTLLNTLQDIATSANVALATCGKKPLSLETYRYLVGEGAQKLMSEALGEDKGNEALANKLLSAFKEDYAKRWDETSRPYEGIEELLEKLDKKGIKLGVLSNKPNDFVGHCVARFFPNIPFKYVAGEQPAFSRKPDPAGAFAALKALKTDP